MNSDVELMCEMFDLATPIWEGTPSELREAISVNPRWSAGRLLTEAQRLIPELIEHRVLFQHDYFRGRDVVAIRNIDVCFGSGDRVINYDVLDSNGLSLRYQISKSGKVYIV